LRILRILYGIPGGQFPVCDDTSTEHEVQSYLERLPGAMKEETEVAGYTGAAMHLYPALPAGHDRDFYCSMPGGDIRKVRNLLGPATSQQRRFTTSGDDRRRKAFARCADLIFSVE
jgi:hypothetical protein